MNIKEGTSEFCSPGRALVLFRNSIDIISERSHGLLLSSLWHGRPHVCWCAIKKLLTHSLTHCANCSSISFYCRVKCKFISMTYGWIYRHLSLCWLLMCQVIICTISLVCVLVKILCKKFSADLRATMTQVWWRFSLLLCLVACDNQFSVCSKKYTCIVFIVSRTARSFLIPDFFWSTTIITETHIV